MHSTDILIYVEGGNGRSLDQLSPQYNLSISIEKEERLWEGPF
jgi:hypothetical protein